MDLKYKNEEIIHGKELRTKLLSGVNKLSKVVVTTLGPNGNTVIISDEYGNPYITKDGVSVSNSVVLRDPVENIAATLLKQVAKNTVEQAGDGTTTSICLAQSFINTGFELLDKGTDYNKLKKDLDDLEEEVVKQLILNSKELNKSNIINVATISANNDTNIGKIIQDAYNHSDIVKVEEGNNLVDELITIDGMELKTGYFNNAFINVPSKQAIIYTDPYIIMIKGKLEKLDTVSGLLHGIKGPIIIIADHFNEQVISILKDNYNRGAITIGLMKSPGFAGHRKNLMEDIAMYANATLLDPHTKYTNLNVVGKLKSVHIGKEKTIITSELSNVEDRLNDLKEVLKDTEGESDKYLLNDRIENLTGKIAIIKVGGKSEVEMRERKDRIDDAVLAVGCALKEGIVEGGGVALFKTILKIPKGNLFLNCLYSPYKTIFKDKMMKVDNKDIVTLDIGINMFKENIIDPLKVTRVSLQNAISVAKTILGTNAIVLNERLWNY